MSLLWRRTTWYSSRSLIIDCESTRDSILRSPNHHWLIYNKYFASRTTLLLIFALNSPIFQGQIICGACGTRNPASMSHCTSCEHRFPGPVHTDASSAPLPKLDGQLVRCPICVRVNNPDARFCDWCGSKVIILYVTSGGGQSSRCWYAVGTYLFVTSLSCGVFEWIKISMKNWLK